MSELPYTETSTRMREETTTAAHGSRTLTVEEIGTQSGAETSGDEGEHVGVLRLRGDMNSRRPRAIQWDESVIDNEHMNKKKTKICCIYHKPHAIGESSDSESSSDSDSSNSSSSEDERGSRLPHTNGKCTHNHGKQEIKKKKKKRNPRDVSPNAYERQPVYNNKK